MKSRRFMIAAMVMALSAFGGAAGAQDTGNVTVVHGIPDLTVDVYVNGDLTLEDFSPGDVAGPLALPAGTYDLAITAADAPIEEAVLEGSAELTTGADVSIVAHLQEDGTPTIGIFVNDVTTIDTGNGRLTVRHTAAAPTVDILLADGTEVFTGVSNPAEGVVNLPAATYGVVITPTGAGVDGAVFGPADLELPEGTNRIVYATGDLAGGSFALVIQDIGDLHSAPAAVDTGSGDLATANPAMLAVVIGSAFLLVTASAVAVRRR